MNKEAHLGRISDGADTLRRQSKEYVVAEGHRYFHAPECDVPVRRHRHESRPRVHAHAAAAAPPPAAAATAAAAAAAAAASAAAPIAATAATAAAAAGDISTGRLLGERLGRNDLDDGAATPPAVAVVIRRR